MALVLATVMLVSCVTTILLAASKPWIDTKLGSLSQYYETGNSADPGLISTVDEDSGGTSYGLYMFVEGTVKTFMDWLKKSDNAVYRGFGDTLYEAYAYNTKHEYYPGFGTNFKNTWQSIGHGKNSAEFGQAQTEFWGSTQYTELITNVERLFPGFDIDNYSIALKNVFWSRSVHHGVGVTSGAKSSDGKSGATGVIYRAFNALGGFKNQSEAELIAAIYAECSRLDPKGMYKEGNMETLTATKYGVYGRSMAYFNVNGGGVQTSVYSRLHVNEPADALVMRYANTTPGIAEGKYTLTYINGSEQNHGLDPSKSTLVDSKDAVQLQLTYYDNDCYILSTADGQRLAISNGKLVLEAPSTSSSQFWSISGGSGYTLQNMGTKQYVTVTVTSKEVTEDGLSHDDLILAKLKEIAAGTAEDGTYTNDAAKRFDELLSAELNTLIGENFKDKGDEAITAMIKENIAKIPEEELSFEEKEALIKKLDELVAKESENPTEADLTQEVLSIFSDDELLALVEAMTGKDIEDITLDVVEQMVAEDQKNATKTTITTYTTGVTDSGEKAARWSLNKATGRDAWTLTGMFYPGCSDSDAIGNKVTHHLTEGNSSFPIRGVVSCTQGIRSVTVEVQGKNGGGFTATGTGSGNWFDLWTLDDRCTFSSLKQGTYTLTITGINSDGQSVQLLSSSFTVGARDSGTTGTISQEKYTVTFKNGNTVVKTKVYKLGDTYGELPEITTEGFQGWFTSDGVQIFSNSMVAAEDHTVEAKFGTLYTVTFKVDGSVVRTRQLAKDSLIQAPANPVKAATSKYVYSFSHWVDDSGKQFVANVTYMPAGNVTYTAVFTQTANSGGNTGGGGNGGGGSGGGGGNGGGTTPTPSGNYLTGVSPSTSVSSLTTSGYTVYNGSTKVTSGLVGTGMTAVSNGTSVTIVVTGDVSGDGRITITDVVKLQSSVAGASKLSGAYAKAGDINGDGKVTITDVVQAAQVTVGQRTIN